MLSSSTKAKLDSSSSHWGNPKSASIGIRSSTAPDRSRYRFHQPVRSETKWSTPAGLHSGWKTLSSGPPATRRPPERPPSPDSSATHSSVPSQGMFGWFHVVHARRRPSGLDRGNE